MSIINDMKDINKWNEDNYGILTYYLIDDTVPKHYEIIVSSYNYREPKEENALGNLYIVDDYEYDNKKLFARTLIAGEDSVKNLLSKAVLDYLDMSGELYS